MRIEYQILGCSPAAVPIILEMLPTSIWPLKVIKNIPVEDGLPHWIKVVEPDDLQYDEMTGEYSQKIQGKWLRLHNFPSKPIMGVWNVKTKKIVYEFFRDKYHIGISIYQELTHTNSSISETVRMGYGTQVGPGCVIAPYAQLDDLVTVNRNVSIGHHTTIGEFSTINPGVNIAGGCKIGKRVAIGLGANITDSIEIGDDAVIGAGSLVMKSVPPNTLVYGVPAKEVRPC